MSGLKGVTNFKLTALKRRYSYEPLDREVLIAQEAASPGMYVVVCVSLWQPADTYNSNLGDLCGLDKRGAF
jgi:hypothetical protein